MVWVRGAGGGGGGGNAGLVTRSVTFEASLSKRFHFLHDCCRYCKERNLPDNILQSMKAYFEFQQKRTRSGTDQVFKVRHRHCH